MKVYRLLIYEGSEQWINTTFSHNAVKGRMEFYNGYTITSISSHLKFKDDEEAIKYLLPSNEQIGDKQNDEC